MQFGLAADEASAASWPRTYLAGIDADLCQSATAHGCVAHRGSGLLCLDLVSQDGQVAVVDQFLCSSDGSLSVGGASGGDRSLSAVV